MKKVPPMVQIALGVGLVIVLMEMMKPKCGKCAEGLNSKTEGLGYGSCSG